MKAQCLEIRHHRKYYVLSLPFEKMALLSSLEAVFFFLGLGKQLAFTFQTSKFIFEVKVYFPMEQHDGLEEQGGKCKIYFSFIVIKDPFDSQTLSLFLDFFS